MPTRPDRKPHASTGRVAATPRKAEAGVPRPLKALAAVSDWVRERIRLGRLVPGQRLIEADIMAATGASRGKVREGLKRLEAEGLVTIEDFRGASVKKLGPDEVRQIYQARMALEGLAAAECAMCSDTALRTRLAALQAALDAVEGATSQERFARLNSEWHRAIIEGSGNLYIAQFLTRLTVPIYSLLFSTFYTTQRIASANADHRRITAAIIEGRAADADRAMRSHIQAGLDALIELNAHFDT
jgi:DNA-binding GntR family transcriptional regulator